MREGRARRDVRRGGTELSVDGRRQPVQLSTGEVLELSGEQTGQEVDRVEHGVGLEQPVGRVPLVVLVALKYHHAEQVAGNTGAAQTSEQVAVYRHLRITTCC